MYTKPLSDRSGGLGPSGWAILVLVLFAALFIIQNTEVVDVTFLFWRLSLSRVVLIIGCVLLGCLIGVLLGWSMFGGSKKKPPLKQPQPPI